MIQCPMCHGDKTVTRPHAHPQNYKKTFQCPVCHGTGHVKEIPTDKTQITILYADYSV